MHTLSRVITLALVLIPGVASAQPGIARAEGRGAFIVREGTARLVRAEAVRPPADRNQRWRFGPFERPASGFEWVEIYVRPVAPSVECAVAENQGACGTWDNLYGGVAKTVACHWDPALADFRCQIRAVIEMPWGRRTSEWTETLLAAGEVVLPPDEQSILQRRAPDAAMLSLRAAPGRSSSFDAHHGFGRPRRDGRATVRHVGDADLAQWISGRL